jgi:cell division protein FtsB
MLSFLSPRNILLVIVLAMCAYIVFLSNSIRVLKAEAEILTVNNSQLTLAVDTQQATISFLKNQAKLIEQDYRDAEQAFIQARRDADSLKKQLQVLDIDNLSKQSTNASEKSINDTTFHLYRCVELLSGAPLNEKELAAKNSQEFNYMCAWLYKP